MKGTTTSSGSTGPCRRRTPTTPTLTPMTMKRAMTVEGSVKKETAEEFHEAESQEGGGGACVAVAPLDEPLARVPAS